MKARNPSANKGRAALAAAVLAIFLTSIALAANGSLDHTFGSGGVVVTNLGSSLDFGYRIELTADGSRIYALGTTVSNSIRRPVITRYFTNGVLDGGFNDDGKL